MPPALRMIASVPPSVGLIIVAPRVAPNASNSTVKTTCSPAFAVTSHSLPPLLVAPFAEIVFSLYPARGVPTTASTSACTSRTPLVSTLPPRFTSTLPLPNGSTLTVSMVGGFASIPQPYHLPSLAAPSFRSYVSAAEAWAAPAKGTPSAPTMIRVRSSGQRLKAAEPTLGGVTPSCNVFRFRLS